MLDKLDIQILEILDTDARASASDIAKKCKLPKETIGYRIKRLQQKNIIRYFYSIINSAKLGYHYHRIFLQFHKLINETDMLDYLAKNPNCANVRVLEGPYDLVFITTHKHLEHLRSFISRFLKRFGANIKQKSIHTIYSSYKYSPLATIPPKGFSHGKTTTLKTDADDRKILEILTYDARTKLTSLAEKLGKDISFIRYRLKRLEKEGIIVSYHPSIDYHQFKKEHIQIDFSLKDTEIIPSILSYFHNTKTLLYAYELIGKYDLSVEILVTDDTELRSILRTFRESFADNYTTYDVSHVYQELVTNWSPFSKKEGSTDPGSQ